MIHFFSEIKNANIPSFRYSWLILPSTGLSHPAFPILPTWSTFKSPIAQWLRAHVLPQVCPGSNSDCQFLAVLLNLSVLQFTYPQKQYINSTTL